jgi:Flp pilus assembly protein TadD
MFPVRPQRLLAVLSFIFLASCSLQPVGPERPETVPQLDIPSFEPGVSAERAKTLGSSAFAGGDFPVAVRYFQSAAEQAPADLDAWLGLGASADRAGQFEISAAAHAKVLELSGPSVEYYNNRGFSLLLQGRLFDARAAFKSGLRLAPDNKTLRNNIQLANKLEGREPVGRQ